MDAFLKDLKYSIRILRRSPGFTVTALAVLALGIGANTAIFSVINTVLLQPVHFREPGRVMLFGVIGRSGLSVASSEAKFNVLRLQTGAFEDISAYRTTTANLTADSHPEQLSAEQVTGAFFRLAGLEITQGRGFNDDEERPNGELVVILSDPLWRRRFNADPAIVGRTTSIGGRSYRVIGTLAPGSRTEQNPFPDLWQPLPIDPNSADQKSVGLIAGRLNPGVTPEAARVQLEQATREYRRRFPESSALGMDGGFSIQPMLDAIVGDVGSSLRMMAYAVGCVLLIACANIANLLLARATGRKREIAIRAAVGAGRGRVVRQLLTESMIISLAGGALGFALARAGIHALLAASPGNLPRIGDGGSAVIVDWRVALFTLLVSIVTGIVFGLVPALHAARADLNVTLKDSAGRSGTGSRRNFVRSILVVGEVALALLLAIGANLFIETFVALRGVETGLDGSNVLTMKMSLADPRFEKTASVKELIREGIRGIDTVPGVESAAASFYTPLVAGASLPIAIIGRPQSAGPQDLAHWRTVSAGYFDVFKIPISRGRAFNDRDDAASSPVAIVNQAMARLYWPQGDVLNAQVVIGKGLGRAFDDPPRQIVGVVGNLRDDGLRQAPRPAMYIPIAQTPPGLAAGFAQTLPLVWIVRTRAAPYSMIAPIQDELRKASGGLPTGSVRSMDEILSEATARENFNMLLLAIFGGAALLLASIGIYGLMAYTVEQRAQEIGIRMALGAESNAVRRMVVWQGMRLALIGIAIGITAAAALIRVIDRFLYGVQRWDLLSFTLMPALLVLVAFLSVWLPARRASSIDPARALRR